MATHSRIYHHNNLAPTDLERVLSLIKFTLGLRESEVEILTKITYSCQEEISPSLVCQAVVNFGLPDSVKRYFVLKSHLLSPKLSLNHFHPIILELFPLLRCIISPCLKGIEGYGDTFTTCLKDQAKNNLIVNLTFALHALSWFWSQAKFLTLMIP